MQCLLGGWGEGQIFKFVSSREDLGLSGMLFPGLRFEPFAANNFLGSHPIDQKPIIYLIHVIRMRYTSLGFNRVKDMFA